MVLVLFLAHLASLGAHRSDPWVALRFSITRPSDRCGLFPFCGLDETERSRTHKMHDAWLFSLFVHQFNLWRCTRWLESQSFTLRHFQIIGFYCAFISDSLSAWYATRNLYRRIWTIRTISLLFIAVIMGVINDRICPVVDKMEPASMEHTKNVYGFILPWISWILDRMVFRVWEQHLQFARYVHITQFLFFENLTLF